MAIPSKMPAPDAAVLDASRFGAANRKRLSAPGLRAFLGIADVWGLSEQQRLLILGMPSRSAYYGWVKTAQGQGDLTLPADTLTRISAVLGIHKALMILFATPAEGVAWLRGKHAAPLFGGQPPLALAACGTQDGLMAVRRFLDAARGGLFMPPNQADGAPPITDDEIVFV
jgi:hypothetical protein